MKRFLLIPLLVLLALPASARPASAAPGATEAALTGARSVAAGVTHSCAVVVGGQVRCWGDNESGQLGNGTDDDSTLPVTVTVNGSNRPLSGVTQVSAGHLLTCARLTSGQARCWGAGSSGQIGDGAGTTRYRPAVVSNPLGTGPLTNVRRVVAGASHACAVLVSGQARCWGLNGSGQLGDDTTAIRFRPVPVVGTSGTGRLTGVTQMDADLGATCARLATGEARCWGSNNTAQIGDGTTMTRHRPTAVVNATGAGPLTGVAEVGIGQAHGCARLSTGRVWCWGFNGGGQSGDGTTGGLNLRPVPVQAPGGDADLTGVVQLATGATHSCARLSNGQVRCWGAGLDDQIGDGDGSNRPLPVPVRNVDDSGPLRNVRSISIGLLHTCVRLANAQIRCWGLNASGQAGGPGAIAYLFPVVVRIS